MALRNWLHKFTQTVFEPASPSFEILLNSGNTDAWCKIVRLLCEPGDFIICEQHTYPSAQALWIPMGCQAVPVKMDSDGLLPQDLASLLESWDVTHPGTTRPHLYACFFIVGVTVLTIIRLYIVPVGSNPTGLTMPGSRKKEIYDVCVKYGAYRTPFSIDGDLTKNWP